MQVTTELQILDSERGLHGAKTKKPVKQADMPKTPNFRVNVCELFAQLQWGKWLTIDELLQTVELRRWAVQKWLDEMQRSGIISRRRRLTGKKSAPFEYVLNLYPFENRQ